jgi:hypothetical protein
MKVSAHCCPAHIHQIGAGSTLEGVQPLVHSLRLSISLAGPGPSGSTGPSRRCQGCFPPSPAPPGSGCPQLHQAAATARRGGSLTRPRTHGASWRTFTTWNGSATCPACGRASVKVFRYGPEKSSTPQATPARYALGWASIHAEGRQLCAPGRRRAAATGERRPRWRCTSAGGANGRCGRTASHRGPERSPGRREPGRRSAACRRRPRRP